MFLQKSNESVYYRRILANRILWIFFIALLIRLSLIPYINFALDDAYITFSVARNISEGHGMVLNPGEQVLSITTPLYALLMVPGEILSIGAPLWSKILNSIFASFSCVLIYTLLRDKVNKGILLFSVFCLILNPISIFITLTGMESPLVSLLILLSVLFYQRKMFTVLGLVLGLTCLARPEGYIAAILFWAAVLIFHRHGLVKVTIPLAIISLAWFFYATTVFGSVIPNSYFAKQAFFAVNSSADKFANLRSYIAFFTPSIPLIGVAPIFLFFGTWSVLRKYRGLLPVSIWLITIFILQLTSKLYITFWYMHMLVPLIILLFFLGLQEFLNVLPERIRSIACNKGVAVIFGLILVISMTFNSWQWRSEISDMRILDEHMGKVGHWFVMNNISYDMVVGLEAIGRVSYESNLRILDRMGLASPEVIPFIRIQQDSDASIMHNFQPDYYITNLVITEEEAPGYNPIADFPVQRVSRANDIDAIMGDKTYIYAFSE